ncbi:hypothetical protein BJ878DRAFT_423822 [Calycina marina]|uniref:Ubiquitin carboxyl-terminal hydrolase 19 n=1 Tax=Calycina marina TaxID=1763456 RepID=A0A9P7Z130_9HELO|nr:hypothetical protein BJ878DRAFT_423822 [Calycina marina]
MDVKHVQSIQTNHSDRISRLERRQADDAALKSVWGTSSPFPGVLSGTPIQGPIPNPNSNVFDDFTDDDEQGHNLIGSLQLEADEEPVRRGASRANSVRFDVSALQGSNWAQSSRNSGDFGPIRPSSGFGSHPMTERSMSHKSDGRHSSAGHSAHSVHSGRTSSLGLDTNFLVDDQDDDSSIDIPDPPPGLFILGPVPSIIRCWLTQDFSHSALLYADICSGTPRSVVDISLVRDLGLTDQLVKQPTGRQNIRLPVYLPEAIITQPTSRSSSPAPQLPILTADFEIVGLSQRTSTERKNGIRVFIGSDTLRAHNADILLSQNLMTLYGDDRKKLSVPFVRPEDETVFKNLCTSNIAPERNELKATAPAFTPTEAKSKAGRIPVAAPSGLNIPSLSSIPQNSDQKSPDKPDSTKDLISPTDHLSRQSIIETAQTIEPKPQASLTSSRANETTVQDEKPRESVGGTSIWGSWRQGTASNGSENGEPTSGYQRPARGGKTMKVLRPSSKSTAAPPAPTRSSSAARTGPAYEPAPVRLAEVRRKSNIAGEGAPLRWESKKSPVADEHKDSRFITTLPRSSNPVGGASAFSWMAPTKASVTSTE